MPELIPWGKKIDPAAMRKTIVQMAMASGSVHLGSSFSLVEIVSVLYESFVRLNWADRTDPRRDIIALSKGHGVMALYSAFKELGWVSRRDIEGYFSSENTLKGLSSSLVPGIEVSGGSLGHGITVAAGLAFAAKLQKRDRRVFAIVGDGEMDEGSVWEALLLAAHQKLSNLVVIVDANGFQAMGESASVLNLESLEAKFRSFNFWTAEVEGHDLVKLNEALQASLDPREPRPKAIIARTVKGKGVSFMENNNDWHYKRLDEATYQAAMKELSR